MLRNVLIVLCRSRFPFEFCDFPFCTWISSSIRNGKIESYVFIVMWREHGSTKNRRRCLLRFRDLNEARIEIQTQRLHEVAFCGPVELAVLLQRLLVPLGAEGLQVIHHAFNKKQRGAADGSYVNRLQPPVFLIALHVSGRRGALRHADNRSLSSRCRLAGDAL